MGMAVFGSWYFSDVWRAISWDSKVSRPGAEIAILKFPAGRFLKEKEPALSVVSMRSAEPFRGLRVTFAPETIASLMSRTVPLILAEDSGSDDSVERDCWLGASGKSLSMVTAANACWT